jgi:hypothetical protein
MSIGGSGAAGGGAAAGTAKTMSAAAIGGLIVVVALIGVFVIVNVANEFETGGTRAGPGVTQQTCSTKCTWFREKRCEDGQDIGWCFPTWGCGDGVGIHTCVASMSLRNQPRLANAGSMRTAPHATINQPPRMSMRTQESTVTKREQRRLLVSRS